jgi:SnoaL-like domain
VTMSPDEAVAREAIRYTMSVYNTAGDRGRIDEMSSAFTEDGVLELDGVRFGGRQAIVVRLGQTVDSTHAHTPAGATPFVRHNLTTCRIELTGETTADAWTYFNVVTPIGLDHCGVYVDRFVRVDDRWLIGHRRVKVDWRDPRSVMARP